MMDVGESEYASGGAPICKKKKHISGGGGGGRDSGAVVAEI
jgi:hypothetical protein